MKEQAINEGGQQIMSIREAAEFCKVSRVTLNRWMKENLISCIKIGGRVLFLKAQLVEDLKKFEVPVQN